MGEVIVLDARRAERSRFGGSGRPAFFFDLACPFSYLAAERVERLLGRADWIPAAAGAFSDGQPWPDPAAARACAERRAFELRLPLVWPERFPADVPRALRAAAHAEEIGAGAAFALAASRLAFCGGFDLEDLETLAEAAAAAGMGLEQCLAAAGDPARDGILRATAHGLKMRGIQRLPAVRIGSHWFEGEPALTQAAAILRARAAVSPLAPAS